MHAALPHRNSWALWLGLLVLALVPVFASLTDQSFYLDLVNRLMILAIAALSLNLILGHGGMISFGHAAYLGIGAYCVGIPAYYDIYSGWVHFPLAIGASALFALLTGAICLRTTGVYFIMITMAFAQMMFFALVSIEAYGGDDGLVIEVRSEFEPWLSLEHHLTLYYVTFASLALCLYLMHRIVPSRFGMVIEGAKGNERRMQAIGFNTYRYRLTGYIISGAMCGFAGALLGNFTNFISPEMMDWMRSGELIFMVVLGGAGSLSGPVLGAAAFILLEEWLSGITIYWQLMFGAILILTVLFKRGGIWTVRNAK
jgi:branched-chain amino acid transport system permease protein